MTAMLIGSILVTSSTAYAASGDTVVYITKTGKCYHSDGCSSLSKSKIETTLQRAVDKGYTPCSKCKPPVLDAGNTTAASVNATSTNNASTVTQNGITYVANTNTKKFHKSSCASVSQIKPENYLELTDTRDEIVSQGYTPCKRCKP